MRIGLLQLIRRPVDDELAELIDGGAALEEARQGGAVVFSDHREYLGAE